MKNNSSATPTYPELYEKAFRDYFTDYKVLKQLAARDEDAVNYGTHVDYESGQVEDIYRRYLYENNFEDQNPVHIAHFEGMRSSVRDPVTAKITSEPVFAEYLVDIYEAAYNTNILERIKAGLELYPEPYTASVPIDDIGYDADDGEEFSAATRISLAKSAESLKDLNDSNVKIFGRDAVLSARAAGDAAIRGIILDEGAINVTKETRVAAREANEKSRQDLDAAIELGSNKYKLPSKKKKIEPSTFSDIRGIINMFDDGGEAFKKLETKLEKLPDYSFIEAQRSSALGIATFFKQKFVEKSSWTVRDANTYRYKKLLEIINRKFGAEPNTQVAATSGGAARDSPSVWSWFWIAQGFAVVVVTAVVQSVRYIG